MSAPAPSHRSRVRDVVIAVGVAFGVPWLVGWLLVHFVHAHTWSPVAKTGGSLLFEALTALPAVFLLTRLRWWKRTGWRAPSWRQLWLLWLPVAAVVYDWVLARPPPRAVGYTAAAACLALAVGVNEEMWFRGLLLEGLRSLGATWAVIVSAAVFGAWHLLNGRGFVSVLQAFIAFGFGLMAGAARIRIGAIWPLVLIHAVDDLAFFLVPYRGPPAAPIPVYALEREAVFVGASVVAGLIYAVVLTRRSKTADARLSMHSEPIAEGTSGSHED